MRDRIAKHGTSILLNYELLEVLLFAVISQRDTKPTAKALLERFKSFRQIMVADIGELTEVSGIGCDTALFLKAMAEINTRIVKENAFDDAPILSSLSSVISFLQNEISMKNTGNFAALFLGSNNKLLKCDILATGTVNRVSVYPREIVK